MPKKDKNTIKHYLDMNSTVRDENGVEKKVINLDDFFIESEETYKRIQNLHKEVHEGIHDTESKKKYMVGAKKDLSKFNIMISLLKDDFFGNEELTFDDLEKHMPLEGFDTKYYVETIISNIRGSKKLKDNGADTLVYACNAVNIKEGEEELKKVASKGSFADLIEQVKSKADSIAERCY